MSTRKYLGAPWIVKKMMVMAKVTKTFKYNESDGTYTLINIYPIKTLTHTFKFNETLEYVGLDGKKHTVREECHIFNQVAFLLHILDVFSGYV